MAFPSAGTAFPLYELFMETTPYPRSNSCGHERKGLRRSATTPRSEADQSELDKISYPSSDQRTEASGSERTSLREVGLADLRSLLPALLGELGKLSPDTLKGYLTLNNANSQTTKLGEKTRQLISLAVAVTTRCDGCIVFHTDAALKAGATKEEIAEALGVAVSMNAGAALIYSARVLDAVDAKSASHASAND